MTRWVLAICLLLAVPASARDIAEGRSTSVIRSYPFDTSGVYSGWHRGVQSKMVFDGSCDPSGGTCLTSGSAAWTLTKYGAGTVTRMSDWTYPNGFAGAKGQAHKFSVNAGYQCTPANCPASPAGSFSVIMVVTKNGAVNYIELVSKFLYSTTDPYYGWLLGVGASPGTSVSFGVSMDGGRTNVTTVTRTGALETGRTSIIIATYEYITDGTSKIRLYADDLAVASSDVARGPVYNADRNFRLVTSGATSLFTLHHAEYVDGIALTEKEAYDWMYRYKGMMDRAGNHRVSTVTATPPAIIMAPRDSGVEPFMIRQPVNSSWVGSMIDDHGGVSNCPTMTNRLPRSSICETPDASNQPTGWTVTETAGDGGAAVTCDVTTYVEALNSLKMVLTGDTSVGAVTSGCMTSHIGEDMYVELWAKKVAGGTANFSITIEEFDNADCTNSLGTIAVKAAGDLDTDWDVYGGPVAIADWDALTSSYNLIIQEDGNGGVTTYVDSPHVTNAYPTKSTLTACSCTADTDAARACSTMISNSATPVVGGGGVQEFEMSYVGLFAHGESPRFIETGVTTNAFGVSAHTGGVLRCGWYDSGSSYRSATTSSAAIVPLTPFSLLCTRYNNGNISGSIDGTAFTSQLTTGLALQSGVLTPVYFGQTTGALVHYGKISNVVFRRRATQ